MPALRTTRRRVRQVRPDVLAAIRDAITTGASAPQVARTLSEREDFPPDSIPSERTIANIARDMPRDVESGPWRITDTDSADIDVVLAALQGARQTHGGPDHLVDAVRGAACAGNPPCDAASMDQAQAAGPGVAGVRLDPLLPLVGWSDDRRRAEGHRGIPRRSSGRGERGRSLHGRQWTASIRPSPDGFPQRSEGDAAMARRSAQGWSGSVRAGCGRAGSVAHRPSPALGLRTTKRGGAGGDYARP